MRRTKLIAIGISAVIIINSAFPTFAASTEIPQSIVLDVEKSEILKENEDDTVTEQESSETVYQYAIDDTNIILDYVISEEKVEIIGCNTDAEGSITIPERINEYPVEMIGDSAFFECKKITEVNIPDSVITIGASAFEYCELMAKITLSDNLENLGNAVFKDCHALNDICLPDTLTYIPDEAFEGCWELRDVEFPKYMTMIGDSAFERCIVLKSLSIPEGVERIGSKAFAQCGQQNLEGYNFKTVTLPSTIQSIGKNAFGYCSSLEEVNFPEGLVSIEEGAFAFCYNLKKVELPDSLQNISAGVFAYCKKLEEVKLPENMVSIPNRMFNACYSLSQIKIPETVQSIGESAFSHCPIKVIILPKGLQEIGKEAFENCTNLVEIELPSDLKIIGSGAFAKCNLITSVKIPEGVTSLSGTFQDCTALTEIYLPPNLSYLGDSTFEHCSNLTEIEIPETVEELGAYAFSGCSKLKELKLSENIKKIGAGAFSSCKEILEFTLPSELTEISDNLFGGCKFSSIELPDKITRIGEAAFVQCTNLLELTIPSGVTEIGDNAFQNCTSLETVDLPNSVTKIGNTAFSGCQELSTIDLPDEIKKIGELTFDNCRSLKTVILPKNLESIGYKAFYRCAIQNLVLPKTLKKIDYEAFERCGILELYIPDSVSEIDPYCLFEYSSIQNVHLPSSLDKIGWRMFANSGIVNISVPKDATVITAEAFNAAGRLVHVDLPENLKTIEREAFGYCAKLTEICFHGNAPQEIAEDSFLKVTATVYYPIGNETWTEEKKQNYGGTLTWVACEPELMPKASVEVDDPIVPPQDEGIVYEIDYSAETVKVTGCSTDTEGVITIAEKIKGYPVTEIAEGAFENCKLITTLIMPEALECIDKQAFAKCSGLNVIRFQGNAPEIAMDAFYEVQASVHYPEQNLSWTEEIRKDYGGKLTWYGYGSSSEVIRPGESSTYKPKESNATMTYTVDAQTGEVEILSCNKSAVGKVVIPSNIGGYPVTKIKDYAFKEAEMETVELSEGIKTLGEGVFYYCKKLKTVKLPEKSLTEIADGAFYGCSNLTEIYIPDSVVRIGISAFTKCTALNNVRMPKELEILDIQAFYGCRSLEKIVIPKKVTCISKSAFEDCTKLTELTLLGRVNSIEENAFAGCSSLINIEFPKGLTSLGSYAFKECSSLINIELPEGITNLGDYAFSYCSGLTNIKLPEGITNLGDYTFSYCSGLTNVKLPEGLTSLGNYAFCGCRSLTSIELPKSLVSIGSYAFVNCEEVIKIIFNSMEVPAFDDTSFYSMNNLKVIYVPGKAVETYKEAFSKYITDAITILPILEIIKQPEDQTVGVGDMAVFEVEALGNELNYQWQYSTSGKYWFNSGMEGTNTAVLSVEALEKRNGQQYRCLITDSEGNTLISDAAVLTINENMSNLIITEQPKDQSAEIGSIASFCVVAEGTDLSYQWQYSKTGVYWYESSMEGSATSSMKVLVTEKRNNYQYRCLITDSEGNTWTSDVAVLTITENMPDLTITEQPQNQSAEIGSTASFCVVAEGTGLSYQWQYSKTGVYWYESSMEGSATSLMKVVVTEKRNNYQYRCLITDSEGNTLISDAAVLTIIENMPNLTITEQPKDQSAEIGSTANFCVAAEGTGLSYQWQYSTSGKYWFDSGMEGANTEILEVPVTLKRNGQQYRCVITDESGNKVITDAAMLIIK